MTIRGVHCARLFSRKSSSSIAVAVMVKLVADDDREDGRVDARFLAAASEFPVWDPYNTGILRDFILRLVALVSMEIRMWFNSKSGVPYKQCRCNC